MAATAKPPLGACRQGQQVHPHKITFNYTYGVMNVVIYLFNRAGVNTLAHCSFARLSRTARKKVINREKKDGSDFYYKKNNKFL